MMGGAEKIVARGRELFDAGDYLLASEIVNKLVQAEPDNQDGKELLSDIFEQLGYQQENPGLRNSFLAAAYEMRSGVPQADLPSSASPEVIRAMSTELFLNFLGIRMDGTRAAGKQFKMNLITPDNGEKFIIELRNQTLTNIAGYTAEDADLTLTINRSDLEMTMMGAAALDAQIADGTAKAEGNPGILAELAELMVDLDPKFEIMPGTHPAPEAVGTDPFKGDIGAVVPE
jgi:alkyl sulfatase BDS1-like metallo-beta-lactamase superfamily hydrolase